MDFVFSKPQTSFSPAPKDHGSLTLKEFVTESLFPSLINLRSIEEKWFTENIHPHVTITSIRK